MLFIWELLRKASFVYISTHITKTALTYNVYDESTAVILLESFGNMNMQSAINVKIKHCLVVCSFVFIT